MKYRPYKFLKYCRSSLSHLFIIAFILLMFLPLYLAIVAASHQTVDMIRAPLPKLPGNMLLANIKAVLHKGLLATDGQPVIHMLWNSFLMAILIALGKVLLAITSAFALVYFSFPFKRTCFVLILATMMLPVEVRIVPTFQVMTSLGWMNSFAGLTFPLLASATATFIFRQFFKTLSPALVDAAKLDGAGPYRFFFDIVLPLSKAQISALFIIMFVYGWNQYLWPLVITTNTDMATIVMGIRYLVGVADQIPQWNYIMATALIALLPPCLLILILQRWFEKGLIE